MAGYRAAYAAARSSSVCFGCRLCKIIRGALRMGGGAEYRALIVLQHRDPRCDVGGVILAHFRRQAEIGAKEC
jgi:hypothetical protein